MTYSEVPRILGDRILRHLGTTAESNDTKCHYIPTSTMRS